MNSNVSQSVRFDELFSSAKDVTNPVRGGLIESPKSIGTNYLHCTANRRISHRVFKWFISRVSPHFVEKNESRVRCKSDHFSTLKWNDPSKKLIWPFFLIWLPLMIFSYQWLLLKGMKKKIATVLSKLFQCFNVMKVLLHTSLRSIRKIVPLACKLIEIAIEMGLILVFSSSWQYKI